MRSILLFILVVAGATAIEPAHWHIGAEVDRSSQVQTSNNFCQGCRSIVSYMSRFNGTNMRDEYRELFRDFCELYYLASTDYQQGPCPIFIEGFFYVLNQVDPVYHCDQIGACADMEPEPTSLALNNEVPRADGPVCKVCEEIVQQVKKQLEDPDFVRQVQERVDAFCTYLKPIGEDEVCRTMLRQNLDEAIEFIEAIEPSKYCQSLQLCEAGKMAESKTKQPTLADYSNFGIETSVEMGGSVVRDISFYDRHAGPKCVLCKRLVKELFKFLRDNRTEENIRTGLDQICNLVYSRGPNRDECDQLVATYSKEFVQVLTQETDPELVCIILGQCYSDYPKSYEPSPVAEIEAQKSDDENSEVSMSEFISMLDPTIKQGSMRTCVECKLFITYLQDTLDDKKSQEQIKEWLLKNLCDSLDDASMKSSCTNLVERRAADFFKAIAENLNPKATCQEFGACKQKKKIDPPAFEPTWGRSPVSVLLLPQTILEQQVTPNKWWLTEAMDKKRLTKRPPTPFCEGCVRVVGRIDEYLSTHSVQHDVNELITEVCDKLATEQMRSGCTLLIKYYGQQIMQHISTMDEPRQLCTKIALC